MGHDVLSMRQMMVFLAVGLMAPVADLLPGSGARMAGAAGWLAPLGALPLLLLALGLCGYLCREGTGLGEAFQKALGNGVGKVLILMYMVWFFVLLAHRLRLCSARLAVIYSEGPAFLCAVALTALAVWMALAKAAAFARAGEIFYLALLVALAAILILAIFKVYPANLIPNKQEWAALPAASGTQAGVLLCAVLGGFFGGKVTRRPGDRRRAAAWTIAFCVAATLLTCAVTGNLGPTLTARMPAPFLTMVQGLGIEGTFQRTEALAASLWALADLVLVGLFLLSWKEMAYCVRPGKWAKWSILPVAALALAAGWLLFPDIQSAAQAAQFPLGVAGLCLGLAVPALLCLVTWRRSHL